MLIVVCISLLILGPSHQSTSAPPGHPALPTSSTGPSDDPDSRLLETTLLKMFGFSSRPKHKDGADIPDHLLHLYREKSRDTSESGHFSHSRRLLTGSTNTVRSFYHIGK